jgi:putative nucleotidyltransferase with HDIG domain
MLTRHTETIGRVKFDENAKFADERPVATQIIVTGIATALKNLPPFPPVACKVMNLLGRPDISFREVGDTLKTDAALTAEVLRLANSALAGPKYRVTSVMQALAMVGSDRLAGLLLTLSLSKILKRAGHTQAIRNCWRHSLASALAAREFASSFGSEPEEAYQAGLFHDLGCLAFLVLEPRLFEELIREPGDLLELERTCFGVDHCEAGALLIEQWKLPQVFADVARNHHDPQLDANNLTMVVHAACVFADQLGFSLRPPQEGANISEELGFSIAATINSLECEYDL